MSEQKNSDKYEVLSVKIRPDQAVLLNTICDTLGVNTYQIFQMFFYVLCKASSPMHELSPEIRKLMTMMEADASWAEAFNLANPNELDVAQVILILQQRGKHGFGAVMIDKPWMGMKPKMVDDLDPMRGDPQMTENVDDILERVTEVCMHGIYRRLRLMGARMDCKNLSDVLLTLVDAQTVLEMDEESKAEMKGEAMYDVRGRRIEYGKKTKGFKHRTPDSLDPNRNRLLFQDIDHDGKKKTRYRPEHQRMLNDRRWLDTKRVVWQRAGALCEWCKRDGFIVAGVDCHHLVPFESAKTIAEAERLCYDPNNCVLLCIACHQRAHKELMSKTKEKVKERREQRFSRWVDKMKGD